MPDFDIIGTNPYGGQSGQGAAAGPNAQGGMGQPQGAPISGLLAGILGLPTYGGTVPGASYTTPAQQPGSGPGMQPQQAQQLLQLMRQAGQDGQANSAPAGAAQPQNNLGTALGSSVRSLFDGIVGSGS